MKWLLILLSLYVLALSAVPCCGGDLCCDHEITLQQEDDSHENHDHNKPELPCSPFFSCGMCHGMVIPLLPLLLEPESVKAESTGFNYTAHFLSGYATAIWQPPQSA